MKATIELHFQWNARARSKNSLRRTASPTRPNKTKQLQTYTRHAKCPPQPAIDMIKHWLKTQRNRKPFKRHDTYTEVVTHIPKSPFTVRLFPYHSLGPAVPVTSYKCSLLQYIAHTCAGGYLAHPPSDKPSGLPSINYNYLAVAESIRTKKRAVRASVCEKT